MQDEAFETTYQRAAALHQAGRFGEAVEIYLRLARQTLTVNLAANLGAALGEIGERAQAEHYLAIAAHHKPHDASIRRMLGFAYSESGKSELAEAEYRAALAAEPDNPAVKVALAGLYLSMGRYAEGWPLMGARVEASPDFVPPVTLSCPEWRGQSLTGKSILVWVEQGLGDQIQFSRFATLLKARGASRVTLGCRPPLTDLFRGLEGVDDLAPIAAKAIVSVATPDYWSRYVSLPEHLGIALETLPAQPYLAAPADRRAQWADFRGPARVGLTWLASPTGFNAANKGLPPDQAQRLRDVGAISLQPEDTGAQDFADTAAIVETLDLVVSIDTSVAHLAGAMGKPCWTLLPYIKCDWRWLRERTDSPWYPGMRLYRQTRPRDWSETIDQVLGDLEASGLAKS